MYFNDSNHTFYVQPEELAEPALIKVKKAMASDQQTPSVNFSNKSDTAYVQIQLDENSKDKIQNMINTEYSAQSDLRRAKSPGKITVEAAQRIQVGSTNLIKDATENSLSMTNTSITFLGGPTNIVLPVGADYNVNSFQNKVNNKNNRHIMR